MCNRSYLIGGLAGDLVDELLLGRSAGGVPRSKDQSDADSRGSALVDIQPDIGLQSGANFCASLAKSGEDLHAPNANMEQDGLNVLRDLVVGEQPL